MTDSISIGAAYRDQKIVGGSLDNTPIGADTAAAVTATVFSATTSAGFYGSTPVAQRGYSSALHATSGISSSTDFGATQLAWAQEVQNTLIGLGIWATA